MTAATGGLLVSAVVLSGSILGFVLVRLLSIRAEKKARLEIKRHLQKKEVPASA